MVFVSDEFRLTLPDDWQQWESQDLEPDTTAFYSNECGASVTLSTQFYQVSEDKMMGLAQAVLDARAAAHAEQFDDRIEYLQDSVHLHSSGTGLEMFYRAQVIPEKSFFYLGYVTTRKVLNLFVQTFECDPEKADVVFGTVLGAFEPRLP
jgi:hypothetical protein